MGRPRTLKVCRSTAPARFIGGRSSRLLRRIFYFIRFWPRTFDRQFAPRHLRLGRKGERMASDYLRRNGYRVLYRNFRSRGGGEIDLVCRDRQEKTLVFVEVKNPHDRCV